MFNQSAVRSTTRPILPIFTPWSIRHLLGLVVLTFSCSSSLQAQDNVTQEASQASSAPNADPDPNASDDRPVESSENSDDAGGENQAAQPGQYTSAVQLLPQSLAGIVRIPNLPRFCDAFEKTHLGQLLDEESMQPFIESQRARVKDYLQSLGNKVGLTAEDLYAIASGEVVIAWLPFEKDARRPFAVCIVADVRGMRAKADQVMATLDQDLKAGGWERKDVTYRDQEVRVYGTKPKPGQLKVEQIAITLNDQRIIAADRDSVVTDLLDAIAGEPKGPAIAQLDDFQSILKRSTQAVLEPVKEGGGTVASEWFIRPFQMGRIVRESLEIDRGNDLDILKLLENQGFSAIRGAGGVAIMAGNTYDLLHRGYVIAPPEQMEMAARMLQFRNQPLDSVPQWAHADIATFSRLHIAIEEAFWASETLVNEAVGDEIFRDIIEGIRDDEDGPQIDIAKNVLPNLDNQVIMITDTIMPADLNSDRMLVALRLRDADAIRTALRKAMEVEPDAERLDVLPGVEIWEVRPGQNEEEFDPELFGDLDLDLDEGNAEDATPLLDHWAIAVVDKGPGSDAPYLMFSSHPEFLVLTAERVLQGGQESLGAQAGAKRVQESIKSLGGVHPFFDRIVRSRLSLRTKYNLFRQGRLRESSSVLASIARRVFTDRDDEEEDRIDAQTLPPFEQIEAFLPDGGGYMEVTQDGWAITGFLLK